ncbi:hypothetical protein K438DRAFT_1129638 [Mycena galopus ATCC 62051]|nr:hypothetical protein K438DRAFT_1129638 [Mycena galopus ATCC 62051]
MVGNALPPPQTTPSMTTVSSTGLYVDLKKTRLPWQGGSRNHLPRFDPQLPHAVWKKFKEDFPSSIIFTSFFSDMRHQMLAMKLGCTGLQDEDVEKIFPPIVTIDDSTKTDTGTMGGSWLHLAVTRGDLPLAHECVRLGTPIEFKDRRGHSALYHACTTVKNFLLPDGPVSVRVHLREKPTNCDKFGHDFVWQLIQICVLLLEHHADPNETHDGLTLLDLVCLGDQWDLIEALLLHGASLSTVPTQRPVRFLKTQGARSAFDARVAKLSGKPRPSRLCPCGSRRALDECHSKVQPHPEDGICPCGAGKIHDKCCSKLPDMYWVEKWGPCTRRLERVSICKITTTPEIQKMMEEQQICATTDGKSELWREKSQLFSNYIKAVLEGLEKHGKIDPAYAAAGRKVHVNPI